MLMQPEIQLKSNFYQATGNEIKIPIKNTGDLLLDVLVLENVYLKLRPYAKGHPNVNMYVDEEEASCPYCGGKHLQLMEGKYFYTQAVRYSTFRCMNCGAISRSKSAVKYNFKKKISAIPK